MTIHTEGLPGIYQSPEYRLPQTSLVVSIVPTHGKTEIVPIPNHCHKRKAACKLAYLISDDSNHLGYSVEVWDHSFPEGPELVASFMNGLNTTAQNLLAWSLATVTELREDARMNAGSSPEYLAGVPDWRDDESFLH